MESLSLHEEDSVSRDQTLSSQHTEPNQGQVMIAGNRFRISAAVRQTCPDEARAEELVRSFDDTEVRDPAFPEEDRDVHQALPSIIKESSAVAAAVKPAALDAPIPQFL
jgi:hypothetical protein